MKDIRGVTIKQNQRKILLIEPPFYRLYKNTYSLDRYPLSLAYLSGTIREKTNWGVIAYNADFHPQNEIKKLTYLTGTGFNNYLHNLKDISMQVWQEIKSNIEEYKPSVLGISTKSQNFASSLIIAKIAKEINKEIIVIMGGPHPSMVSSEILTHPEIDICVKGEGEDTIVELLDAIDTQKELDHIQGIIYRKGGDVIENPPREYIKDLDSLCFPHKYAAEVLKDYHKYPISAFQNIFATRGCPYNCFFCGSRKIWSRKVRFRSAINIAKEIKSLQKIGLQYIHFADDTFGINKENINNLCKTLLHDCPGIKWSCEINVRLVNEENILRMKSAGCDLIQIGIESGNNEMLSKIRKNITREQALDACKLIKKNGIKLQVYFMVGFPDENEDTLHDTVTAMKKSKCDEIIYSIFTPYPGTEIFDYCKEKGLIKDDYNVSLYNHKSPANSFCLNISPDRFRFLAHAIEEMVERKNRINMIKQAFTFNNLRRVQELGIGESFRKAMRIFINK